ncbi:hypothetical protein GETHLI_31750 [Geothrix limicola]|uniref:Uncharacterized protein n=1 Tax=Geothrix limicola TaxID=2927978 RepID=A0ABQ5QJE2_9BACT|nr:hypothetical protein [Geothrix limicola]GLH74673.1 hypothetical protein GETHLI_31750 [Geothrix limicola]
MLKSAFVFVLSMAASAPALLAISPAPIPVADGDEMKTICPVTGKAIPPGKGTKVTVRGQEYTVIDKAAADKLAANPDLFLNPDGTPKNAEKKEPKPY